MRAALMNLGRHVRRRPGLAWVLIATALLAAVSVAGVPPQVRLPILMVFLLTVPGFLILDLRQPTDVGAKVAMGIASSVSFYIVCVSISLLASVSWIAPTAAVFLTGLIVWLLVRRRQGRVPRGAPEPVPANDTSPARPDRGHSADTIDD